MCYDGLLFSFLLYPSLLLFLPLISLDFLCLAGRATCITAFSLRFGFHDYLFTKEKNKLRVSYEEYECTNLLCATTCFFPIFDVFDSCVLLDS